MPFACVNEECGDEGAEIAALRGWLWGSNFDDYIAERLGIDKNIISFSVIADHNSKIIGIYKNKTMPELFEILKKHPNIADFKIGEGLKELGDLKIGGKMSFSSTEILNKRLIGSPHPKFYFLFVRNKVDPSFYPYYECGVQIEEVIDRDGAFYELNPDKPELIEKLGLNPSQVARGEITAVILTDGDFKVIAVYPDRDMRDLKTILNKHLPTR